MSILGWFILGLIASVVWGNFKKRLPKLMYVAQKKIEADEIKTVVKLFEEKYGKSEFKKLIGKDPSQLTLKELNNKIEDYEKYSKKKRTRSSC